MSPNIEETKDPCMEREDPKRKGLEETSIAPNMKETEDPSSPFIVAGIQAPSGSHGPQDERASYKT